MQECSESQGKKIIYLENCSKVQAVIGSPVDSFPTLALKFHPNTRNSQYFGVFLAICGAMQYVKI